MALTLQRAAQKMTLKDTCTESTFHTSLLSPTEASGQYRKQMLLWEGQQQISNFNDTAYFWY
jgi:hypothetical protein